MIHDEFDADQLLTCNECGQNVIPDPTGSKGVYCHMDDGGGVDYDADADHVPVPVNEEPKPVMKPYTVVAEYWDNEQTYVAHVRAENPELAAAACQDECRREAVQFGEDEPGDDDVADKLKVRCVFEGHHMDKYDDTGDTDPVLLSDMVLNAEAAREFHPVVAELKRLLGQ